MLSGSTIAAVLAAIAPLLEAFFNAFGTSLNDYAGRKRSEQTAQDLGAARATIDQQNRTIAAQDAELAAQADAPRTAADAIARLEEGSA